MLHLYPWGKTFQQHCSISFLTLVVMAVNKACWAQGQSMLRGLKSKANSQPCFCNCWLKSTSDCKAKTLQVNWRGWQMLGMTIPEMDPLWMRSNKGKTKGRTEHVSLYKPSNLDLTDFTVTQVRLSLILMQCKLKIWGQNNFIFWMAQSVTILRTKSEGTLKV